MTRRTLVVFTFFLVLVSMLSTGTPLRAAAAETYHLSKTFTQTNPCNGEVVTGTLNGTFVVQATFLDEHHIHVVIHASAHGVVGNSDSGNRYQGSFEGTETFDLDPTALPPNVYVPLHAQASSVGSEPNFTADGVARVSTTSPDVDVTFTPSCG
jgi:hypothetical protein